MDQSQSDSTSIPPHSVNLDPVLGQEKKRLIEQALASSHCRASMPLLVGDLLNSETLAQGQTIRHRYSACPNQTLVVDCLSQHGIDWISHFSHHRLCSRPSLRRRSGGSLIQYSTKHWNPEKPLLPEARSLLHTPLQ